MKCTLRDFLDRLVHESRNFADQELIGTGDMQYYKDCAVFFLYVKSVKTFDSIVLLLKHGRDEDAKILLRSLLENLLVSDWMQYKGDSAFLRFWRHELTSKIKDHDRSRNKTLTKRDADEVYLDAQTNLEQDLMALNKELSKIDPTFNLDKQRKEFDRKDWWAGIPIGEMADGLSEAEKTPDSKWKYDIPFYITSRYVHPNPVTVWDFLRQDDKKIVRSNFSSSDEDIIATAVLASESILELMKSFDRCFCLRKEEVINVLELGCSEIFKEYA